jgi:hypothetical protein
MKFDELDRQMRVFETARDYCVLPEIYMVARLDGRSFTRLTKEVHQFNAPYDDRFRDYMLETVEHFTGETILTTRSRIRRDLELPMKDEYDRFIEMRIVSNTLS